MLLTFIGDEKMVPVKPGATLRGKTCPIGESGRRTLKRIPDSEVEHHVTDIGSSLEVPFGALGLPGRPKWNRDIDAQHQDSKVESKACACADGEIIEEVRVEDGSGSVRVVSEGPDVAEVGENSPADEGEELCPVFNIALQFDVSGLIRKIRIRVGISLIIRAGSEGACAEGADIVRAAGEESPGIGETNAIAIGNTDAGVSADCQHGILAEVQIMPEIDLEAHVLR